MESEIQAKGKNERIFSTPNNIWPKRVRILISYYYYKDDDDNNKW
jgi:hypothetical protein